MASPHYSTEDYRQAFIAAAFDGNFRLLKRMAKILVEERGISKKQLMEIYDSDGKNALLLAAYGMARNKLDICKYLVEELKFDVNAVDDTGFTPLQCITLAEDFVAAAYLLEQGADPNIVDYLGISPLLIASKKGRVDGIQLLISKGTNVDADLSGGTPLLTAALHGMSDAVEVLLKNHADPNLAGPKVTPLVQAILAKSIGSIRALLKWGANPNGRSRDCTPLVTAVKGGETEIIKLLLTEGADPNVPAMDDRMPIEIAADLGNRADVMTLFPLTKPITSISDWSVDGILQHFESEEAENKFLELKAKGAEAFGRGEFLAAVDSYTEAMKLKPADAAILSNRSLCWERLKRGDLALQDAIDCITLRKDWPKAHYRAGMAYALLQDYKEAVKEFEVALKLEPNSKELQDVHREAVSDLQAVQMHEMKIHSPCEEFKQVEQDDEN